jgi:hypothetical protein
MWMAPLIHIGARDSDVGNSYAGMREGSSAVDLCAAEANQLGESAEESG